MAEEKKGPDGQADDAPGKKRTRTEKLHWRLLQCFLLFVVVALLLLTYHHVIHRRDYLQLLERSLILERENILLSERLLKLDRKVQALWNEEDNHANDVEAQSNQVNGMDEDGHAFGKRMKRGTEEGEETAADLYNFGDLLNEKSGTHRVNDVIAVHVEARIDEHTPEEFNIEEGHDILTMWQPLHYPHDGFTLQEGILTVKKTGLYYIYSQVFYTEADVRMNTPLSHTVVVNEEEEFLTCVDNMIGSPPLHTCFTAGVRALEANEFIHISMKCQGCSISLNSDSTFFGAILLKEYESRFGFVNTFFPNESGG